MGRLSVDLCGIEIDNPIIPASGTFGYGVEFSELYDINKLGTFSFKGTTKDERFGNPTPRITEAYNGIINSVGLQNPGVEKVISEELPRLKKIFNKPVMANVSGFSVDDYTYVVKRFSDCDQVGWIEVNISCPNVHGGGAAFGTTPSLAAEITREVRKTTSKPIIMKLTPNVTDIKSIAKACEDEGADAISLINTVLSMRIDINSRKPILANQTGGMSGPAVFPLAVRMVWDVYNTVSIPVIGLGGISTPEDVIEMMMAGATAVEIGAANLVNPYVCPEIINKLPETLDKYNIKNIKDIIGGAH